MEGTVVSENRVSMLPLKNDNYNGIIVELEQPMEPEAFRSALRASMAQWRRQGKKGIWLKFPIRLVNLVEIAVQEGFWYHHAEPSYLMLVNWIPESTCTLPANASHRVGVGAIVVNDKRQILAVQENSGAFRGTGIWKIPTGVVDEGEDIWKAAVREVKEETGVDAEFIEILGFRQAHRSFFNKSDLFFLCFLRPLSADIHKQDREIQDAQWMPLDEFAAQPIAQKPSLFKYIVDLCITKFDKDYTGFSPRPVSSAFEQVPHCLYLNTRDSSQSGSGYST